MKKQFQFTLRSVLFAVVICAFATTLLVLPGVRIRRIRGTLDTVGVSLRLEKRTALAAFFPQFGSYCLDVPENFDSSGVQSIFAELAAVRRVRWKNPKPQDLKCVLTLPCLEELELIDVTGSVCLEIGASMTVRSVTISGFGFTGEDISELSRLRNLENLDLSYTSVTDASLHSLTALKKLRKLHLSQTLITDFGISELSSLPLELLDVSETAITDSCLQSISQIGTLRNLRISTTRVTDVGLCERLRDPAKSSLRELVVSALTYDKDGTSQLERSFPKCSIGAGMFFYLK